MRSAVGAPGSLSAWRMVLQRPRSALGWFLVGALGVALAMAVIVLPGALHNPAGALGRVPAAREAAGTDRLAVGPDPHTQPAGFATFVSDRLDAYWRRPFRAMGVAARPPALRLFDKGIAYPCAPRIAFGDSAPFYCFVDGTIYLPVSYVSDLAAATGPAGRIAVAYVLAHEYAHHMQHVTGLADDVELQRFPVGSAAARQALVHYELQADCLAGVWLSTVAAPGSLDPATMGKAEDAAALLRDPLARSTDTHGPLPERQQAVVAGSSTGRASACASW